MLYVCSVFELFDPSTQVMEVVALLKETDLVKSGAQDRIGLFLVPALLVVAMTTTGVAQQLCMYIARQLLDYTNCLLPSLSGNDGQVSGCGWDCSF